MDLHAHDNAAVAVDPSLAPLAALAWCAGVNIAVVCSAWRFGRRRMSHNAAAAVVDAGLLWYAVQYASVALPGLVGHLDSTTIGCVALFLAAVLLLTAGWERHPPTAADAQPPDCPTVPSAGSSTHAIAPWLAAAALCFAAGFLLAYAYSSRYLPILSNDALTYHFPAAVTSLAARRICLLPTWFFNPANTYSPLAGSMFITWWLAPLGNDVLARFVELPPLLLLAAALYQLARQLRVDIATAAVVAASAIVVRPFLHAALLGKDDLAETFFFCAVLIALCPRRCTERAGPIRLGLALGLLLATKYTALLAVPILLLAVDGPWRAGWRWRWGVALAVAAAVAGPWYLRNWILTGNPLFPLTLAIGPIRLARGLFSTTRSAALHGSGAWTMLTLPIAIPAVILAILLATNAVLLLSRWRACGSSPLLRAAAVGPAVGLLIFVAVAPFPEARFVYPVVAILFVAAAGTISLIPLPPIRWMLSAALLALATLTSFKWSLFSLPTQFAEFAAAATAGAIALAWLTRRWPAARRLAAVGGLAVLLVGGDAFVHWNQFVAECEAIRQAPGVGWSLLYRQDQPMWARVDSLPADATVAYTNTYLIYPMQGFSLGRKLVYAPTRPGIHSIADLPPLGTHQSGEAIVTAAARALVADPDRSVWLANLRAAGAQYLVVFHGGVIGDPPEARFASEDPVGFVALFQSSQAALYEIRNPEIRNKLKIQKSQ